ncbi:hypothetical protein ACXITY_25450, partial [Vibrio parahaemolyticus]
MIFRTQPTVLNTGWKSTVIAATKPNPFRILAHEKALEIDQTGTKPTARHVKSLTCKNDTKQTKTGIL